MYIVSTIIVNFNNQCQLLARALRIRGFFFNQIDVCRSCYYVCLLLADDLCLFEHMYFYISTDHTV